MPLPSIYTLTPLESGGRAARSGFNYQDHIGVLYIIRALQNTSFSEIWFESEDDISIIWHNKVEMLVEFVQVKSNDLSSRWSVSKIVDEEILERSLQRGRCTESVRYRIVTSCDVDKELAILKFDIGSAERNPLLMSELVRKVQEKKQILPNPKGQDVGQWFEQCVWEKAPDSVKALESQNKIELEAYLQSERNKTLPSDCRDELYQKLLGLVYKACLKGEKNKFTRLELDEWIDSALEKVFSPKAGSEKLVEKMESAGLSDSVIESAKEMKWQYITETLNNEFISRSSINKFKERAQFILNKEKIRFDNGDLSMSPGKFHEHCLELVVALGEKFSIDPNLATGCMYEIANRCQLRFLKVTV